MRFLRRVEISPPLCKEMICLETILSIHPQHSDEVFRRDLSTYHQIQHSQPDRVREGEKNPGEPCRVSVRVVMPCFISRLRTRLFTKRPISWLSAHYLKKNQAHRGKPRCDERKAHRRCIDSRGERTIRDSMRPR